MSCLLSSNYSPNASHCYLSNYKMSQHHSSIHNSQRTVSSSLQVKKLSSSRRSSLKRFITNNSTSKVVRKEDIVIINVDEDCAILQMIDFHLHGKMGRVVSIVGDEVELEMMRDSDEDTDDDWIFIGNSRVVVPIFCLCLEDRVLQSRLLS
ncbi:predicted protein [Naegleria gruberi]|uniref:Predicted protein n=1 Tax=Naegleria gruberi TaxID=5762 RepID=D2VEY9_NAEGR|nr:uncharacterized protein NAEGRDRAFT_67442 [Naegleria gruberi]EFC44685.1 predicted protein [Naegleria gruberi]|eukprot:XP_002677429.1 predicted protein [Naegleria gruberi strain NEG-M]